MARKNKPTVLKILEGNPGKQKLFEEPLPPSGKPEPPPHLDKYALEEWNRIAEGLYIMGVLASIDQSVLAAYCNSYSIWRHAMEELEKLRIKGGDLMALIHKTTTGAYIPQPLLGVANKAAADMVRYASEFGMTPAARARLAIDPGKGKESKFERLIGGKK